MKSKSSVILLVILVVIVTCFIACKTDVTKDPLRRTTKYGVVEGYADDTTSSWVWKGIPFARPPVGELRWRAPQDPESWDGVKETKEECPTCTQLEQSPGWVLRPNVRGGEDCLYLNIYRPPSDEDDLPVYFWIHGGANMNGYADEYDMENLAIQANMVVVVIQYRLNVFGYFTHPSLRSGVPRADASGNFGTLDQIKALQWVRDNIEVFGGNPDNVTIAGESAGGHNVMALMISPLAKGLFHRAVMESGGMVSQTVGMTDQIANRTIETALAIKDRAQDIVEAKSSRQNMTEAQIAEFMRSLSATELLQAHAGGPGQILVPMGNVIEDGFVIPGNLLCTVEAGDYNQVPLMAGANKSESGSINTLLPSLYEGMPNYQALLDVVEGKRTIDEVLPTQNDKKLWTKARYYGSQFWRAEMVDELARRAAAHQDDVYIYSFNWGEENVQPNPLGFIYGAAHVLEIPFFHGNVDAERLGDWLIFKGFTQANRPGRQALSKAMVSYLAQFCRSGNPNKAGSGLPEWKSWSNEIDEPKINILDADLNKAMIRMDTEDVSMASVRQALDAEDPMVRKHVMALLTAFQSYAAYEPGQYEYNPCK